MKMSNNLKDVIHQKYVSAAQAASINPVEVEENLRKELENIDFSGNDAIIMDYFLDKLDKSILARKQTHQMTNVSSDVLHTAMYIIKWLNHEFDYNIDTNIVARRKGLDSELAKMLSLADEQDPTQIMDRFGIRFVLENNISTVCKFMVKFVNIVCHLNRQDLRNFMSFVETSEYVDDVDAYRIKNLLRIPFSLKPLSRKSDGKQFDHEKYPDIELPTQADIEIVKHLLGNMKFYFIPKSNGYQSIHVLIEIESSSPKLPGFQIEVQFRTHKMDDFAENNINASHILHKGKFREYLNVFTLSEEELKGTNIRFFRSYKNEQDDQDGIHYGKKFYNRRINTIS